MNAKKSLGQHFLKSDSALNKIADSAEIEPGEVVLEIGPGHGELTQKLLDRGAKVVAIEKDESLVSEIKYVFKEEIKKSNLKIINSDIREIKAKDIFHNQVDVDYKLVGNIPYYITGFILRSFLSSVPRPKQIVFLIQKEVAKRITSSEKESLLSLSVKAYSKPKIKGLVKAGSFSPPPKVDSAILSIENITDGFQDVEEEKLFFKVIQKGFSQKRKIFAANLSDEFDKELIDYSFKKCGLEKMVRAEDVSLDKMKCLVITLKKD